MNIENIKYWITLIILIIALCYEVISLLVNIIKNKWFSKIYDSLKLSIREAEEKFGSGHGEEKKEYVINKMKKTCDELGIKYKLIAKLINKTIEKIVENHNIFIK